MGYQALVAGLSLRTTNPSSSQVAEPGEWSHIMTDSTPEISTREAFYDALDELVVQATENGIAIEGGWECGRNDGQLWDVVIVEVVQTEDDEE